jgi:hypothetical protein
MKRAHPTITNVVPKTKFDYMNKNNMSKVSIIALVQISWSFITFLIKAHKKLWETRILSGHPNL